jgi:hypothetical protein
VDDISLYVVTSLQGGVVVARSFEDGNYMKVITNQLIEFVDQKLTD